MAGLERQIFLWLLSQASYPVTKSRNADAAKHHIQDGRAKARLLTVTLDAKETS
jgi:hypothetical protein